MKNIRYTIPVNWTSELLELVESGTINIKGAIKVMEIYDKRISWRGVFLGALILLTACTTPKTVFRNEKTGQVAICGGNVSSSVIAGYIGYGFQKKNDEQCVNDYKHLGFSIVHTDDGGSAF